MLLSCGGEWPTSESGQKSVLKADFSSHRLFCPGPLVELKTYVLSHAPTCVRVCVCACVPQEIPRSTEEARYGSPMFITLL